MTEPWTRAQRLCFRFACAYLLLYLLPTPIGWIPGTELLSALFHLPWEALVAWVGDAVLRLDQPIERVRTASGDTLYHYVATLCAFVLALAIAAVWTLVDRRSREHALAHHRLRIYVRYALAFILIQYGLVKIFKTQFWFPEPDRLIQPYGESSPMALMWTFMGYSAPYNLFTGAIEIAAGALLFFRRTTTLGALVCAAIMGHIVVLNLSYDVPVKLFSLHLLLISGFLLLPDARRLANLFFLDRPVPASGPPPSPRAASATPFRRRERERTKLVIKLVVLGALVSAMFHAQLGRWLAHGDHAPKHPLYGLYEVTSFEENGEARPPLLTDSGRWHLLAIRRKGTVTIVRKADGTAARYRMRAAEATVLLIPETGAGERFELSVSRGRDSLELAGTRGDTPVHIRLRERDLSEFLLLRRGFNWVQPRPFNQ